MLSFVPSRFNCTNIYIHALASLAWYIYGMSYIRKAESRYRDSNAMMFAAWPCLSSALSANNLIIVEVGRLIEQSWLMPDFESEIHPIVEILSTSTPGLCGNGLRR